MIASFMPRSPRQNTPPPPVVQDLTLPFGVWLRAAVEKTGITLAEAARKISSDYNYLWRLSKGINTRPGHEKTLAIGRVFGDVVGAMKAAGYSYTAADQAKIPPDLQKITVGEMEGQPVQVLVARSATEEQLKRLRIAVQIAIAEDNIGVE